MSSSRKKPYFFNKETKQSVWEQPDGLTHDDVEALPGFELLSRSKEVRASHLLVKNSGNRNPSSWREVTVSIVPMSVLMLKFNHSVEKNSLGRKKVTHLNVTFSKFTSNAKKSHVISEFQTPQAVIVFSTPHPSSGAFWPSLTSRRSQNSSTKSSPQRWGSKPANIIQGSARHWRHLQGV